MSQKVYSRIFKFLLTFACSACTHNHNTYLPNSNSSTSNAPIVNQLGGGGGGGTGDGGGGQGILCSESAKDPRIKGRLLLRDVFEAITNNNLEMKRVPPSANDSPDKISAEAIKVLTDSLKNYFGPASDRLEFTKEKNWNDIAEKIKPTNQGLKLTADANSFLDIPKECSFVQIASWADSVGDDNNGTFYVDPELWQKLDQLNKAALLAHEYFYKQARSVGFTNSDFVRNKIGLLLSMKGLSPLFEEWEPSKDPRVADILPARTKGFKVCEGTAVEDQSSKLLFYQYQGKDRLQHMVVTNIISDKISFSSFQNAHFKFDPEKNKDLTIATDLMTIASGPHFSTSGSLFDLWYGTAGLINSNASLNCDGNQSFICGLDPLSFQKNGINTIWTGTLNKGYSNVEFSILDPVIKSPPNIKNVKFDDLFSKFRDVVFLQLNKWGMDTSEYQANVLQALNILKSEMDSKIKQINNPKANIENYKLLYEFPKWATALHKLDSKFNNKNTGAENTNLFPELEDCSAPLDYCFPSLILRFKLNILDEKQFKDLYYILYETTNNAQLIEPGKLFIKDKTDSLNFNLTCVNPVIEFRNKIMSSHKQKNIGSKNEKLNLLIKGYQILNETNSGNIRENTKIIFQQNNEVSTQVKPFLDILTKRKPDIKSDIDFNSRTDRGDADPIGNLLITDLQNEKSVSVFPCYDAVYPNVKTYLIDIENESSDQITTIKKTCYLLQFEASKNRYLSIFKETKYIHKKSPIYGVTKLDTNSLFNSETHLELDALRLLPMDDDINLQN